MLKSDLITDATNTMSACFDGLRQLQTGSSTSDAWQYTYKQVAAFLRGSNEYLLRLRRCTAAIYFLPVYFSRQLPADA
jgi:hypothetical protein